jgi:anti-sigma regulatory factor (Ser/Thr protein kinase)
MCNMGLLWRIDALDAGIAFQARGAFLGVLKGHLGWSLDVDAANVVFTELLGNVLRHGKSPVSIWLECGDDAVKLHVRESGTGFSTKPALPEALSIGGRGLFLASTSANRLEIEGEPRGTHIVATLLRKT